MSKIIQEVYENRIVTYEMGSELFLLLKDAFDKSEMIQSGTKIAELYLQLPDELQRKIRVTTYGGLVDEETLKMEADLRIYII